MSLEDLKEHGVVLPEEEWGAHRLETTVPEWTVTAIIAVAVGAIVVAYVGDGSASTWVGVALYILALFGVVWICDRATLRQRRRVRRERKEVEE